MVVFAPGRIEMPQYHDAINDYLYYCMIHGDGEDHNNDDSCAQDAQIVRPPHAQRSQQRSQPVPYHYINSDRRATTVVSPGMRASQATTN